MRGAPQHISALNVDNCITHFWRRGRRRATWQLIPSRPPKLISSRKQCRPPTWTAHTDMAWKSRKSVAINSLADIIFSLHSVLLPLPWYFGGGCFFFRPPGPDRSWRRDGGFISFYLVQCEKCFIRRGISFPSAPCLRPYTSSRECPKDWNGLNSVVYVCTFTSARRAQAGETQGLLVYAIVLHNFIMNLMRFLWAYTFIVLKISVGWCWLVGVLWVLQ